MIPGPGIRPTGAGQVLAVLAAAAQAAQDLHDGRPVDTVTPSEEYL